MLDFRFGAVNASSRRKRRFLAIRARLNACLRQRDVTRKPLIKVRIGRASCLRTVASTQLTGRTRSASARAMSPWICRPARRKRFARTAAPVGVTLAIGHPLMIAPGSDQRVGVTASDAVLALEQVHQRHVFQVAGAAQDAEPVPRPNTAISLDRRKIHTGLLDLLHGCRVDLLARACGVDGRTGNGCLRMGCLLLPSPLDRHARARASEIDMYPDVRCGDGALRLRSEVGDRLRQQRPPCHRPLLEAAQAFTMTYFPGERFRVGTVVRRASCSTKRAGTSRKYSNRQGRRSRRNVPGVACPMTRGPGSQPGPMLGKPTLWTPGGSAGQSSIATSDDGALCASR